jgi:hypothetical protein
MKGHDHSPCGNKYSEVDRRAGKRLQKDVAGDFSQYIWYEEETEHNVPLMANKIEVSGKALDLSIANVGPV